MVTSKEFRGVQAGVHPIILAYKGLIEDYSKPFMVPLPSPPDINSATPPGPYRPDGVVKRGVGG
jgi:hypothetical protein